MKNILLPTDYSEVSIKATRHAACIAKRTEGKITVVHVPCDEIEDKGIDFLLENAPDLKELKTEFVLGKGEIVSGILDLVKKINADLIIMGTYGDSRNHLPYGSYTYGVIEQSTIPVLAIPVESEFQNVKKILYASDFKAVEHSDILKTLTRFAQVYDAEVHILNVKYPEEPNYPTEVKEELENTLEYYLETIKHTYSVQENSDIVAGIDEYVKAKEINLLAMMPRKNHSFNEAVKGRLVKNIALKTEVPLLTFNET